MRPGLAVARIFFTQPQAASATRRRHSGEKCAESTMARITAVSQGGSAPKAGDDWETMFSGPMAEE